VALAHQPIARSRLAVVGETGMGKSVFRNAYLRDVRRVVLLTPFPGEDRLGGGECSAAELQHRVPELRSGVLRLVVRPLRSEWDDLADVLERVCDACERIGNLCLAIEEISFFVDGPSPSQTPAAFRRIVVAGRHQRVSLVVVAQRVAQIPTVFRGNLSRIVAYRQPDPDDAAALARRLVRRDLEPELQALPEHHFVDWTPTGGVLHRPPLPVPRS
jgi:hypothetical protein